MMTWLPISRQEYDTLRTLPAMEKTALPGGEELWGTKEGSLRVRKAYALLPCSSGGWMRVPQYFFSLEFSDENVIR